MPDWEQMVRERLGGLRLPEPERREVIAEVAAHLEDCHQELCTAGSPDPVGYTLAQVPDWEALGRKIRKAKEVFMSYRRQVTLPGVAALLFSGLSQILVFRTASVWWRTGGGIEYPSTLVTVLWVLTFVLSGSIGAALARHAGAAPRRRILAGIYPSFQLPWIFVVVWIATLIQGGHLANRPPLVGAVLAWAGVTAACALGALPWLFGASRTEPAQPPRAPASA